MITDNIYDELRISILDSFSQIIDILKSLGNENRLKILLSLLEKNKSYGTIVKELSLKKTAVSNHLTQLLNTKLIERGDYGIYKITGDGIEILKGIEKAYQQSPSRKIERFQALQRRSVSKSFVNRFSYRNNS